MLSEYIAQKLSHATYKLLEDNTYSGEIAELPGVWADGTTLEACREQLREVLESWMVVKLRHGDTLPGFESSAKSHDEAYA